MCAILFPEESRKPSVIHSPFQNTVAKSISILYIECHLQLRLAWTHTLAKRNPMPSPRFLGICKGFFPNLLYNKLPGPMEYSYPALYPAAVLSQCLQCGLPSVYDDILLKVPSNKVCKDIYWRFVGNIEGWGRQGHLAWYQMVGYLIWIFDFPVLKRE